VLLNTVQGANFAVDTSATPNTFTLSAAYPPTSSTETPFPIFAKFESNGGSGSMANQVSSVTANLSTNSFTKSGSIFYGWNTESNGTGTAYKNSASYAFTSSITLHAQWSSNSVPVNFVSDGGSAVAATSVDIGSAIPSAPTPPEKSGYTFDGWKATDGGSAVSFPYYPILTRTYATSVTSAALVDLGRYEHKGLWVSSTWYGPNRGTTPASTRDFVTYSDGAKYVAIRESNNSELSNPLRMDGYYLIPLDTSTTLTAIWTPLLNTITYDLNGGSGTTPTQADVETDGTFTTAETPVRNGWGFDGWSDGSSVIDANTPYTVGTSAVTLTAQWTALTHSITYDLNGGSGSTPTQSDVETDGTFTTASEPSRDGYTFTGWQSGDSDDPSSENFIANESYTMRATDLTLTAQWTALTHSITYDLNGGSGSTPTQADVETDGTFTTAETPARTGWRFDGWSDGSATIDSETSYTVGTSAVTLTAQWAVLTHRITYDLNDGGVGTAPTQADVETDGSFTTAETPVRTGWTFNGWSDGSTTFEAETSYTVGASAVTLTALWTRNALSVTFDSQNWQTEIITSTEPGTSATTPSDPTWYGYNFKGWSETPDGAVVGVSTVTIFGAKTFYAIWEQRSLVGLTGLSAPDILNAHSTLDRTVISSLGTASTTVKVPGGALPDTFQVRVYTLPDDSFATQVLGAGTFIISQVVAWSDTAAESFGNIQDTAEGKPIEITITSPDIKVGAKVYSVLGNISTLLGTATQRGSVTVTFSQDPVIIVEAAPADDNSSGGSNPEPTVTPPVVGPSDTAGKTPKAVNFTGFNPNSWALTKAIKTAINKFFKQIATPTKVRCVGNTVGPKILKRFKKISYQRGKVVCNYIAKNFAENAEIVISGVPLKFVDNRYRRTRVVLSY
jgi:uncharacterized repeat protein (TIGR02543 family)